MKRYKFAVLSAVHIGQGSDVPKASGHLGSDSQAQH